MVQRRKIHCPQCGFLDTIKKGKLYQGVVIVLRQFLRRSHHYRFSVRASGRASVRGLRASVRACALRTPPR